METRYDPITGKVSKVTRDEKWQDTVQNPINLFVMGMVEYDYSAVYTEFLDIVASAVTFWDSNKVIEVNGKPTIVSKGHADKEQTQYHKNMAAETITALSNVFNESRMDESD